MKRKTTPNLSEKAKKQKEKRTKLPGPSQQTLAFLRFFAHNYHMEPQLPEGLQEIIVG